MKKLFGKIACLVLALSASLSFGACEFSSIDFTAAGKSAYDIAVDNGFVGTQKEWLESLKGEKGEDGQDGQDGGKSAYEIAFKNGFVGTEQEWLQSLKGENGKDADDLSVQDLFDAWKQNGGQGTFDDFLETFRIENTTDETAVVNSCVRSVVAVWCTFAKTSVVYNRTTRSNEEVVSYSVSGGSGVVYELDTQNGDAYIITNFHVVYEEGTDKGYATHIYLYEYGNNRIGVDSSTGLDETPGVIEAEYIGGACEYDIAVLKVTGNETLKNGFIQAAKIGASNNVKLGEKVYVVGNADGEGVSVTNGIISYESQNITIQNTLDSSKTVSLRVLRTCAAINHGNSGGGMFNEKGELIGIPNAKSGAEETDNMGYALPITTSLKAIRNALDNGKQVKKAQFGIMITWETTAKWNEENECAELTDKIIVSEVMDGVAKNVLKANDVITSLQINNGETQILTREYMFLDALLDVRLNDTVTLGIVRDGQEKTVSVQFKNESDFALKE